LVVDVAFLNASIRMDFGKTEVYITMMLTGFVACAVAVISLNFVPTSVVIFLSKVR
jgi:hypothetical protein